MSVPRLNDRSYCTKSNDIVCQENVIKEFSTSDTNELCHSSCLPSCEKFTFDISDHSAVFPTTYYIQDLLDAAVQLSSQIPPLQALLDGYTYLQSSANNRNSEVINSIREATLKLTVSYNDLTYSYLEESLLKELYDLFGNYRLAYFRYIKFQLTNVFFKKLMLVASLACILALVYLVL